MCLTIAVTQPDGSACWVASDRRVAVTWPDGRVEYHDPGGKVASVPGGAAAYAGCGFTGPAALGWIRENGIGSLPDFPAAYDRIAEYLRLHFPTANPERLRLVGAFRTDSGPRVFGIRGRGLSTLAPGSDFCGVWPRGLPDGTAAELGNAFLASWQAADSHEEYHDALKGFFRATAGAMESLGVPNTSKDMEHAVVY